MYAALSNNETNIVIINYAHCHTCTLDRSNTKDERQDHVFNSNILIMNIYYVSMLTKFEKYISLAYDH